MFSGSQSLTRFVHEEKGFVESYEPNYVPAYPCEEDYVNHHHDFATYDDGNYLNDSFSQTPPGSWCRH